MNTYYNILIFDLRAAAYMLLSIILSALFIYIFRSFDNPRDKGRGNGSNELLAFGLCQPVSIEQPQPSFDSLLRRIGKKTDPPDEASREFYAGIYSWHKEVYYSLPIAFSKAIKDMDLEMVKKIMNAGINKDFILNIIFEFNRMPGGWRSIEFMIRAGCFKPDILYFPPIRAYRLFEKVDGPRSEHLLSALMKDHPSALTARIFVSHGVNISTLKTLREDGSEMYLLHYAAEEGNFILIDNLIAAGAFPYIRDHMDRTFLTAAIFSKKEAFDCRKHSKLINALNIETVSANVFVSIC